MDPGIGPESDSIVVLHLNTLQYDHTASGKRFAAPFQIVVLSFAGNTLYQKRWHAFKEGESVLAGLYPEVTEDSLKRDPLCCFFDRDWPVLARILRGKIIVCHDAAQRFVPLRMGVRNRHCRDIARHQNFRDYHEFSGKKSGGEAIALKSLASIVCNVTPTEIEDQAMAILQLYVLERGNIELENSRKDPEGVPKGLGGQPSEIWGNTPA